MAYRSFRKFLDALEQAGELKRVAVPVDTDLLIAEWADREMKSPGGGKARFFEQPIIDGERSEFPLAINTMGSHHRMALALQVSDIGDIAQEIQLILKARPPTDLRGGWSLLKQGINLLHARPKQVNEGVSRELCTRSIMEIISPCTICRFSNVGRKMADALSPWRMYTPAIRRQA